MEYRAALANYLLPKNYALTRAFYALAFALKSRGKVPLLIYQMGKVGSSTLVATLKPLALGMYLFHIHCLTDASIAAEENFYFGTNQSILRASQWPNTVHLFASHYLRRQLNIVSTIENQAKNRWKIITLVREPVARNISAFFESIEYRIPDFYPRLERGELSLQEMGHHFIEQYDEHRVPLHWFDDELKQTFGLDVYASPFPHEKGYQIYETPRADVLLIRLESLSECYKDALHQFLGVEAVELVNANDARDKAYYPTYRNFVKSISLADDYLQQMYDSKYVRHFYTSAEIDRFWKTWQRSESAPSELAKS